MHPKSFVSNFWGAVHLWTAIFFRAYLLSRTVAPTYDTPSSFLVLSIGLLADKCLSVSYIHFPGDRIIDSVAVQVVDDGIAIFV